MMMDARFLAKTPTHKGSLLPKRFKIGLNRALIGSKEAIAPLLEIAGRSWIFESEHFESLTDLHMLSYEEAKDRFETFRDDLTEVVAPQLAETLGFHWGDIHLLYNHDNEPTLLVSLYSDGYESVLHLTDDILPVDELMASELGRAALAVWLHDFCTTSVATGVIDEVLYMLLDSVGVSYSEGLTPDKVLEMYRSLTEAEREEWDDSCADFLMEIGIDGSPAPNGDGYRYDPLTSFEGVVLEWKRAIENARRIDKLMDESPDQSIKRFLSLWEAGAQLETANPGLQKFLEKTAKFARSGLCGKLSEVRKALLPDFSPMWQFADEDGCMPIITTLIEEVGIANFRNNAYEAGEDFAYIFEPEKISRGELESAFEFMLAPTFF